MDWRLAISLLVPEAVVVAGWFVVHRFNSAKDFAARRRELIVGYLIDAYRKLEKSADPIEPQESWKDMESAIADIQLFGSGEQVNLAQQFAREIAQRQTAFATTLLEELRRSLRSELKLAPVAEPIIHLRFRRNLLRKKP
ncbi:hypothetical protein [Polaromonas sp.]|uniref:hypothetical protein n=1 Tax=Polaromonas sp. TaxID=1869339 RepID=UPI0024877E5B|nr:hypothetical protein [Polaromonas sp.]MDI1273094.1 hypothetical protein [Polaromonas sp.]